MTDKLVHLTIDNIPVSVPPDTLVVDAAKQAGINIPVFCYHPKLHPVGMCRMCLVEIGRPLLDRASGEFVRDADGAPKLQFSPKLETACTTPVTEGMVVITNSQKVADARREVLEFILTSHPLDCPICDKGGECPLQNLTMEHGPGQSRFLFDEKMHLDKHVPLGELIYLDRERCIQCGRCVRFQNEVADDPVIAFSQRGRALEIITQSTPGFDSIFSGNTTDICPVGALTTADFRFAARPWELKAAASICQHCAVGCNIVFNVRREALQGGRMVIKRVMPRQNEQVNEIWICDKGRFAYHYVESPQRLTQPMIRKDGALIEAEWDEALDLVAKKLTAYGASLVTLAGGRLSNEDLFNLYSLTHTQGGQAVLYSYMAGGDLTAQVGIPPQTDLGKLGAGCVILVIACDLHEEAPLWWLRIKAAAQRGASLIVLNPRTTRLDRYARHVIRYEYGAELAALSAFQPQSRGDLPEPVRSAVKTFQEAENVIILYGSEGLGLQESKALAHACAGLLIKTYHIGRSNNGLVAAWHNANLQGAWDMGFSPINNLAETLSKAGVTYVVATDPAGDDPQLAEALQHSGFLVVQDILMTETVKMADVFLPAQAYMERGGSYTSGERRLQRFYPAVPPPGNTLPDFAITARISQRLGRTAEEQSPARILLQIAATNPAYAEMDYQLLAQVHEQQPLMGRHDLYYGGTTYENRQGLGAHLSTAASRVEPLNIPDAPPPPVFPVQEGLLTVVPTTRLYDRGSLLIHSNLLHQRLAHPTLTMHPKTAEAYQLSRGQTAVMLLEKTPYRVEIDLDEDLPHGIALLPRSVGIPLNAPQAVKLRPES
ncbi:MAG: NADH-quinone oxidoreductase subunit NuoG [Anaerolineae bacterium]|nr:NADH-quinone oxidoreductase subunit NuoG [Anaerolineae bacterium]